MLVVAGVSTAEDSLWNWTPIRPPAGDSEDDVAMGAGACEAAASDPSPKPSTPGAELGRSKARRFITREDGAAALEPAEELLPRPALTPDNGGLRWVACGNTTNRLQQGHVQLRASHSSTHLVKNN